MAILTKNIQNLDKNLGIQVIKDHIYHLLIWGSGELDIRR